MRYCGEQGSQSRQSRHQELSVWRKETQTYRKPQKRQRRRWALKKKARESAIWYWNWEELRRGRGMDEESAEQ